MPRECLFCDRNADSQEHLWSKWVLETRPKGGWGPIRHSIGGSPQKIIGNADLTVGSVCTVCNNGWMSDLETLNKPLIGCLMHDLTTPIDAEQQRDLALWTLKTAMVLDSVRAKRYYERSECEALRQSAIPRGTKVWVGRSALSSLAAFGTDLRLDIPDAPNVGRGGATTIVVGHLAIQILATHPLPAHKARAASELELLSEITPKPGEWDAKLIQTWPVGTRPVMWPPSRTFTNGGEHSIARLMDRWRIGDAGSEP
jgi:hypothetical protein